MAQKISPDDARGWLEGQGIAPTISNRETLRKLATLAFVGLEDDVTASPSAQAQPTSDQSPVAVEDES